MAEETITRRDHATVFTRDTTVINEFKLQPFQGFVIEVEDVHFHFDSAVFLADYGDFAKPVDEDDERVVGLSAIRACYQQAKKNPQQKLLVAGHTDTKGTAAYNFPLSRKRANNFLAVLTGDRDSFVAICLAQHKVEDYQQILKWVAYLWDWPCDPEKVDDVQGPKTEKATKAFQHQYNVEYEQSIAEDGVVGKETWGAFFDVYMCVLEDLLNTDDAGLQTQRAALNFLDPKTVGCGLEFPIDQPRRPNYRSQTNRRIECLFFEPPQIPQVNCHPSEDTCTPLLCEIYNPKMYRFTHIPVPPTKYHREFQIKMEYGDIDALFTEVVAKTHTDPGIRERLQAIGCLYEPLDSPNIAQRAQDAWAHFKDKVVKQATDDAAADQLPPLVRSTILDQNKLPAPGSLSKIRLPGAYCITDAQDAANFFGNPGGGGGPFSYRYQSEMALWKANPNVGLLPITATVKMRRACKFYPAGAGVKVHFQLLKPDDIPAGSDVAATPLRAAPFASTTKNSHPPPATLTFNMTGSPQTYVTTEKGKNAPVADDPQVDNAHQTVGGKRGNAVAGTDKLKNVLEITTEHDGFQTKFDLETPDTSPHPNAVVVETSDAGIAAVIFMPAWTGGDRYKIRAFVDPLGGQPSDGTEEDAAKDETGTMVVWRILRFSKYLRWAYPAGVSAADKTNSRGELPTLDIANVVAAEYKKSWFDVTVEDDAKAPQIISQADWQSAMHTAKTNVIAAIAAGTVGLNPAYDVQTLIPDAPAAAGGLNNPSVGFMNFLTAAQYDAAAKGAAPPGGWPSAVSDASYWNNMSTLFHAIKDEMIAWFTKNAISGLTVIQSPVMCSLSNPRSLAGRPGTPWRNSGWGTSKRGCYVVFGQDFYSGPNSSLAYDHDHNTLHETGHVLFGVHQYTDTNQVNSQVGGIFDEHDYHDLCIMGYMACSGGFCGRCVLNQSGWNTRPMLANSPGP